MLVNTVPAAKMDLQSASGGSGQGSTAELATEAAYVDASDTACSLCDDGGMQAQSYRAKATACALFTGLENDDTYATSYCNPMSMPKDLAKRIHQSSEPFKCPSCLALVQRCFGCKEEGDADLNHPFCADIVVSNVSSVHMKIRCANCICGLDTGAMEGEEQLGEEDFGIEDEIESGSEQSEEVMEDEAEEDQRANDTACALCDDGGNIMSCDGTCMRSFHVGTEAADLLECNSMGMPQDLAQTLVGCSDTFLCPNCLASVQQCFRCKKEGCASTEQPCTEHTVLRCDIFECGKSYHARCVGRNMDDAGLVDFVCPLHSCAAKSKCKAQEGGDEPVIPCRRCPTAYHEACIPKTMLQTQALEVGKRVWLAKKGDFIGDGLDRSLLYCMRHKIPKGAANPPQDAPLFTPQLLSAWRLHYAKTYPELESSKEWLKQAQQASPSNHSRSTVAGGSIQVGAGESRGREPGTGHPAVDGPASIAGAEVEPIASPPVSPRPAAPVPSSATKPQSPAGQLPASPTRRRSPITIPSQALSGDRRQSSADAPAQTGLGEADATQPPPSADGALAEAAEVNREPAVLASVPATDTANGNDDDDDEDLDEAGAVDENYEDGELIAEPFPFLQDEYWTKEAMQERTRRLWEQAKAKYPLARIVKETRMPEPYKMPFRKTVTQERMDQFRRSFRMAEAVPRKAKQYVTAALVRELHQQEDSMRTMLAPFLHSDRYTSYGRHFTRSDLLEFVASKLSMFAQAGDITVDFSCGSNEFVPLFKRVCMSAGKPVTGKAFDIITPLHVEDFELRSWFDVTPGSLGQPDRLIIGLNPPYGKNNVFAEKFLRHAANFRPRIIVLIVPPDTKIPPGYRVLHEDRTLMRDKSFYIPGVEGKKKEQWNKVAPSFRIIARMDCYPLSDFLHSTCMDPPAAVYHFVADAQGRMQPNAGFPVVYAPQAVHPMHRGWH